MEQAPQRSWFSYNCCFFFPHTPSWGQGPLQPHWKGSTWKWWRNERLIRELGSCSKNTESAFLGAGSLSCHTLRGLWLENPAELMGLFQLTLLPLFFGGWRHEGHKTTFWSGAEPCRPQLCTFDTGGLLYFLILVKLRLSLKLRWSCSRVEWEKCVLQCGLFYKDLLILLLFLGTVSNTVNTLQECRESRHSLLTGSQSIITWLRIWSKCHSGDCILSRGSCW